jgi:hypothetical protein
VVILGPIFPYNTYLKVCAYCVRARTKEYTQIFLICGEKAKWNEG